MERPALVYALIVTGVTVLAILRAFAERRPRLRKPFDVLGRVEIGAIALLLALLIFFGCLQIVLRNFFNSGIVWADPLMRHIVLWLGCLGGAVATYKVRHINIDVLSRYLKGPPAAVRERVVYLATAIGASFLGLASLGLVVQERQYGGIEFLFLYTWQLQCILPFAFFLITYRSLVNMLLNRKAAPLEWEEDSKEGDSR